MTKHEIAALLCKVLAIITLINAINLASTLYSLILEIIQNGGFSSYIGGPSFTQTAVIFQAFPVIFSIIAGLYLWFRADDMAALMVKESATDTESEPLVIGAEAQSLVFAGLGVYTLLHAIPQAAQSITTYIYLTASDAYTHSNTGQWSVPESVKTFVELGLGLWLLFGASGLVRLLAMMRASRQPH